MHVGPGGGGGGPLGGPLSILGQKLYNFQRCTQYQNRLSALLSISIDTTRCHLKPYSEKPANQMGPKGKQFGGKLMAVDKLHFRLVIFGGTV